MSRIIWLPEAKHDLQEIRKDIARDSRKNADRFIQRIRDTVSGIKRFPEAGGLVPESENDLREIFVSSYRIIYRVSDHGVEILNVIHGARILPDSLGRS